MKSLPLIAVLLTACVGAPVHAEGPHASREAHRVYDASRDAVADVEAALARVAGTERKVIVSLGANWCHDSRGLHEHFKRASIAPIIAEHFEVVWVDVGSPQTGEPRNVELAERFGVAPLEGTPTVVVLDSDGAVLNDEADARSWRNAHSRTEAEVRAELERWIALPAATPKYLP